MLQHMSGCSLIIVYGLIVLSIYGLCGLLGTNKPVDEFLMPKTSGISS
jgi:hypothetical protein